MRGLVNLGERRSDVRFDGTGVRWRGELKVEIQCQLEMGESGRRERAWTDDGFFG